MEKEQPNPNSTPLPNPRPMYQDITLEGCSPPTFQERIVEKDVPTPAVEYEKPPAPAVENKNPAPAVKSKKPPTAVENKKPPTGVENKNPAPAVEDEKPIPLNKTPLTPEQKSPTGQGRLCGEPGKIKLIGPPILKHYWITPMPAFSYSEYFETIPKPTVVNYK